MATWAATAPDPGGTLVVHLLDGPYVTADGVRADLPEGTCPLLVLLVRHAADVERARIARELWPACTAPRAAGNLRTTLWRLHRAVPDLVLAGHRTVRLGRGVRVDVDELVEWLDRAGAGSVTADDVLRHVPRLARVAGDLLPGWDDDAVLVERAWLRQHVLHALEQVARRLLADDEAATAAEVAAALVRAEPLRESAQRLLLEALLAEGNRHEARRALDEHRVLLHRELGVEVAPELDDLLARAGAGLRGGRP